MLRRPHYTHQTITTTLAHMAVSMEWGGPFKLPYDHSWSQHICTTPELQSLLRRRCPLKPRKRASKLDLERNLACIADDYSRRCLLLLLPFCCFCCCCYCCCCEFLPLLSWWQFLTVSTNCMIFAGIALVYDYY